MNITANTLWNITAFAGVFGLIIVFLSPFASTQGDPFGEALIDISENAGSISFSSPSSDEAPTPTSLPEEMIEVNQGDQLSIAFLQKTSRLPFPIASRYESATGKCFYRIYDGAVLTILKDSLVVVDIEHLRRS